MYESLPKARANEIKGKTVVGVWLPLKHRMLVRRFGGGEHDLPAGAKRGPNGLILLPTRELLVQGKQP